jgi:hypothetical protein
LEDTLLDRGAQVTIEKDAHGALSRKKCQVPLKVKHERRFPAETVVTEP